MEDVYIPVFSLEEYATEDGNSPRVGAVLMRLGWEGSALSIVNIEMVLLPGLTVKRYCYRMSIENKVLLG
jgi:hypothetical protein